MPGHGLESTTRFLVLALSALYVTAALVVFLYAGFDAGRTTFWVLCLVGGTALMLVGQLLARAGWLSAILVSIGAVAGGLPLVWTILVPVAVAAVIACSVALARGHTSTPA